MENRIERDDGGFQSGFLTSSVTTLFVTSRVGFVILIPFVFLLVVIAPIPLPLFVIARYLVVVILSLRNYSLEPYSNGSLSRLLKFPGHSTCRLTFSREAEMNGRSIRVSRSEGLREGRKHFSSLLIQKRFWRRSKS